MFSRYAHRFVESRERLSNFSYHELNSGRRLASEHQTEPIFDEPQVLASDHSLACQLRRSTALGPVEILLGIITFAPALGDGAANERLTLTLVDNRGVPPVGALTFAGLNVTMAIGRFLAGHPALRQSASVARSRRSGLYRGGARCV